MIKSVLLATSMLIAAPVFAQDAPVTSQGQPTQDAPATTGIRTPIPDGTAPDVKADETAVATTPQTTPAPATETAQPTPAQPAEMATQTPTDAAAAQPA